MRFGNNINYAYNDTHVWTEDNNYYTLPYDMKDIRPILTDS
jgi:hypothetical protein